MLVRAEAQQPRPCHWASLPSQEHTSLPAATYTLPHNSTLGRAQQAWSLHATLPGGELTSIKYMLQPRLGAQRPSLPPVCLCCA